MVGLTIDYGGPFYHDAGQVARLYYKIVLEAYKSLIWHSVK